jgi:hypothetical protein
MVSQARAECSLTTLQVQRELAPIANEVECNLLGVEVKALDSGSLEDFGSLLLYKREGREGREDILM